MSQSKISLGLIGAGGIMDWGHLPAIKKNPGVKAVAVCGSSLKSPSVQRLAETHGLRIEKDADAVIAANDVDAVIIGTPNILHAEHAIAALKAGKHVLCEKPPALNAAETRLITAAAEKAKRILQFGFCFRYMDNTLALKKHYDAKLFGEVYYSKAGWLRRGFPTIGSWFTQKALSGGGALIDIGIHSIDRTLYVLGYPEPESACATTYLKLPGLNNPNTIFGASGAGGGKVDVEDLMAGLLRFKNGMTMVIEASFAIQRPEIYYYTELYGTKAGARIERDKNLVLWRDENGALTETKPTYDMSFQPDLIYERQIAEFLRRINEKDPAEHEHEQAVHIMRIVDALYKSAETGKTEKA